MNPYIANAREAALSLLKPSARELEYGLALHREALVMESYSLGLHSPIDSTEWNAAAEAGATENELQDIAEEHVMTGWVRNAELRREYEEAWEAAGVTAMFLNTGEEGNNPLRLLKRLARYQFLTDAMPGFLRRVVTVDDILAAHRNGKRGLCFTLNGVPLTGEQRYPVDELMAIRVFTQLGARMMHLTYNRRNAIGDGCGETGNAGLSAFGHDVVREMNRLGVIIDLAHTGWQTCLDTARASRQPVVVSHSGAWAVNPHLRCKPDDVIRAVVDKGGIMGITNVPAFLGGGGTIVDFLRHIDYVAKKFGTEAVCIGTDQAYVSVHAEAASAVLRPRPKRRQRWDSLWPAGDPVFAPEWGQEIQRLSLAWTNWPLFTVGLVQLGYDDDAIRNIVGGNLLRVARFVWADSPLEIALRDGAASSEGKCE